MDELLRVSALTGESLKSKIDYFSGVHHQLNVDFFLWFLTFAKDFSGDVSHSSATLDHSTVRTQVKNKPSILDGLSMFFEVLQKGGLSHVDTSFLRWSPRDRLGARGCIVAGHSLVNYTVGQFFSFHNSDQRNVEIDILTGVGSKFITFDLFADFVKRFMRYDGVEHQTFETWETEPTLGFWPYVYTKYTINQITKDSISYSHTYARLTTTDLSTATGSGTSCGVTIRRDSLRPWVITIEVSEGIGQYYDYGVWSSSLGIWRSRIHDTQIGYVTKSDGSGFYADLRLFSPISIIACAPALYHTQSRAYYNHVGKVSRNFESFMESPGFFPLLWKIATESPSELFSAASGPILGRVRSLVRLVCGLYLAYVFAVRPTLESARDIFITLLNDLEKEEGEASIVFSGNHATFSSLPDRLRSLVTALHGQDVQRYEIRFTSHTKIAVTHQRLIGVLVSFLDDLERFGIEPDPTYLWAAQPFSFVFDWFIPMGALMRDAYNRYKLIGSRGYAFGHSASFTVSYRDGVVIHVYLRSDATDLYIDPPGDSWLQAPGAPAAIAVPLALLQLL